MSKDIELLIKKLADKRIHAKDSIHERDPKLIKTYYEARAEAFEDAIRIALEIITDYEENKLL